MADKVFGPVIPKHLLSRKRGGDDDEKELEEEVNPKRICRSDEKPDNAVFYGPTVLPPSTTSHSDDDSDDDDNDTFGPKLPPDMINKPNKSSSSETDDEDDTVIGPMPPPSSELTSGDHFHHRLAHEINARSQEMKDKLTNKANSPVKPHREEWMMELPPEIQVHALGLGPRKFKTKYIESGDRSVWTKMPGEISKDTAEKEVAQRNDSDKESIQSIRGEQIAKEVDDYNKMYRSESLLEMHRRQKKAKESNKGQTNERRPFSRETDLAVPQKLLTSSKRSGLVKDSQQSLSSKFSRGKNSFL